MGNVGFDLLKDANIVEEHFNAAKEFSEKFLRLWKEILPKIEEEIRLSFNKFYSTNTPSA